MTPSVARNHAPEGLTARPVACRPIPRRPGADEAKVLDEARAPDEAAPAEHRGGRWPLYVIAAGLALSVAWSGLFLWWLARFAGWMAG